MIKSTAPMPVGVHASIAGGVENAIGRAMDLGCDCVQIFGRNPRSWKVLPPASGAAGRFRKEREEAGLWPVVVHTSYLINLSSPEKALFKKSLALFIKELEIAGAIGADYLVTHPGSFQDKDIGFGVKQVASAIKETRKKSKGSGSVEILIENTAGGGSQTGGRLEDIGKILRETKGLNVGLCFDTCHGFAAGYPMKTGKDAAALSAMIDKTVGLKNLKLIHLNDSKGEAGSKLDRHEHIGKGQIGTKGLKAFIERREIRGVPLILETPKENDSDDLKNIKAARSLRRKK